MTAEILTIGDEILRGEILDSNKAFLSERLLSLDIETRFHVSVGDDRQDMSEAFRRAAERSAVVLVSGGLGPTRDDLTLEVLAETFGHDLVLDEASLETLRAFFRRFGREMAEVNAKQAYFPTSSEILPNPIGTAPGCLLEESGTLFFCLPGVPSELHRMMDEQVLPRLSRRLGEREGVVRSSLMRTFGVGESNLEEMLRDVATEPGVALGFRTSFPDNLLRPLARAKSVEEAESRLESLRAVIRKRLGALLYAESEADTLERVVVRHLTEAKRTLATAESCTGGWLAERISSVPGASAIFRGGAVAYSNESKTALLDVAPSLLESHGAVSAPVAQAMADGARTRFGADLAVATTGISGPSGGSDTKPVGLVYLALSDGRTTRVEEFVFPFDRERHRQLTSQVALEWIRRALLGLALELPRWGRRTS